MPATRIVVNIPGKTPYDVRIGDSIMDSLGTYCKKLDSVAAAPQMLVLTDTNVAPLYLARVQASLEKAGYRVPHITVPAGEGSKSLDVAGEVWNAMANLSLTRDCAVVGLGGGVCGDLAAFVASTFMRGIKIVQVPTTLLAMVDSSVGGKTGINLDAGKNLVGTFLQPAYVCASLDALDTLDAREWACGCGEIVKSAAVSDGDFFFWLSENASLLASRDHDTVAEAVRRCVVFKANVVAQDVLERAGVRQCLNFGHTLAHAVETLAGYGTYSHGEAVAFGIRFALALGQRIVGTDADFADAACNLLDRLGLPPLDWQADPQAVLDTMKRDKKARAGQVNFVLLKDVGNWDIRACPDAEILAALKDFLKA